MWCKGEEAERCWEELLFPRRLGSHHGKAAMEKEKRPLAPREMFQEVKAGQEVYKATPFSFNRPRGVSITLSPGNWVASPSGSLDSSLYFFPGFH